EILDHDNGGRDQPLDDLDRLRSLQVEDDALLPRVELAEGSAGAVAQRRARPHHVALGRFELDHLGAEIGQEPRAMRPGDRRREIDDPQAVEGAVHFWFSRDTSRDRDCFASLAMTTQALSLRGAQRRRNLVPAKRWSAA